MTALEQWMAAVESMQVKHIDPTCKPILEVSGSDDEPSLFVCVRQARDTVDQERRFGQLNISTVRLLYWPGESLAQAWVAAGWAGYIAHEALELVTAGGIRPLDPHRPPFDYDKCLRCGFPPELTPSTLRSTLELVMSPEAAGRLIAGGA